MTDRRQAAIDALTAIINARKAANNAGTEPTQDSTIKIDPNLTLPSQSDLNDSLDDVNINDPDGVLDELKQHQEETKSNSTQNNAEVKNQKASDQQSGSDDSEATASSTSNNSDEQTDQSDDDRRSDGLENSSASSKDKADDNDETDSTSNSKQEPTQNNETNAVSDDYADGWNTIIRLYKAGKISATELDTLYQDIKSGKITSI